MGKSQDKDVKAMTPGELRQEVMRLRSKIRWHRDLEENARCWHCDLELYGALPEEMPAGKMTGPAETLIHNCVGYICRQECVDFGCDGRAAARRQLRQQVEAARQVISKE